MPDEMFDEAVQALKDGQRMRAKDLLTRLIKVDQSKPDYWLWMSAAVDSEKEQVFCLQNVLKLDPNSVPARRGLVVLGAMRSEEAGLPPANVLEDTRINIASVAPSAGIGGLLGTRRGRELLAVGGIGAAALVAVAFAVLTLVAPGLFRRQRFVVVTSTPAASLTGGAAATATLPAAVAGACQLPATPNPATPLAAYLCLTQTPTPLAIATEASVSENYNSLKKYYHDSDWTNIVAHVSDVLSDSNVPQNAHVFFYLAEGYRHTGDLANALKYYSSAIQADSSFAPGFWGRALVEITQNKRTAALADFDHGILADSSFIASYLDRAAYYSLTGNPSGALTDLQAAHLAAPNNAQVLASLAAAYVDSGQASQALDQAKAALAIDPGLALAYFARGRAEFAQAAYPAADLDLSQSYRYVLALESPLPAQFQSAVLKATALGMAYDDSDDPTLDRVPFEDVVALGKADADDQDDAAPLALLGQAISLESTNTSLYVLRGALSLRGARFADASTDFGAAITQLQKTAPNDPAVADALVGLGQAQLMLGQPKDAVASFQAAARAAPDSFPANLGLGEAEVAVTQTDAAIAALTTAVGLTDTAAYKAEALYWRAQAYQAAGQASAEAADLIAYRTLAGAGDSLVPTVVARLTAIGPLATSTPTITATPTRTPTGTPVPSATRTPARSPTRTPLSSPTPKLSATPTATTKR
jgi:tetratricopeptide (TPR) repeat protein